MKVIHLCLKATILVLAGLELFIAGSMRSILGHRLLRDKIIEQNQAFAKNYITEPPNICNI